MSLIGVFMTEKRSYKQYPREFKEEAVAMITDQGYSVQKAADSRVSAAIFCIAGSDS